MTGIRPEQRFSEHKDSAIDSHREERGLPKDSQFIFVFEPIFIHFDLIMTLSKRLTLSLTFKQNDFRFY